MTIKTLSGSYPAGYTLAPAYNGVDITNTGSLLGVNGADGFNDYNPHGGYGGAGDPGGVGLTLPNGGSVTNRGTIAGGQGGAGGNGYVHYELLSMLIYEVTGRGGDGGAGGAGIQSNDVATITNFGSITGGAGGVAGDNEGPYGYVQYPPSDGQDGIGIDLAVGGSVTNYGDIEGGVGVRLSGAGTVVNYGTIKGTSGPGVELDASGGGVLIAYGGSTLLGGASGNGGTLSLMGGASPGTIEGISGFGAVTFANGASWDFKGKNTISTGLTVAAGGTLTIDGTLSTYGSLAGLTTVNGTLEAQANKTLSLKGGTLSGLSGSTWTGGKLAAAAGGTLQLADNFIIATLQGSIALEGAGSDILSLKTSNSTLVSIEQSLKSIGAAGALELGRNWSSTLAMSNAGDIELNGQTLTAKSLLNTGTIGSLLKGTWGTITAPTKSTGTIIVSSGHTLSFGGTGNTIAGLIRGAYSPNNGPANLRLTTGTTTLSTLTLDRSAYFANAAKVSQNGILTLSEGHITNEAGATWNMANGIFAPVVYSSFANAGLLIKSTGPSLVHMSVNFTNTGTIAINNGSIDFTGMTGAVGTATSTFGGTISGVGTFVMGGGTNTLTTGLQLKVAHVGVQGASTTVKVNENITYLGQWTQTGGTTSISSGKTLTLRGTDSSLSGTVTGAGTLILQGGSDTLKTVTLSAATMTINNAAVTLQGQVKLTGLLTATTTDLIVASGTTTLTGGGTLQLSNKSTNSLHGADSTARLNNYVTIEGAGQLGGGSMILFNYAGGSIIGNGTTALIIDTGAQTISNTGLIEGASKAGTVIKSALLSNGTLETKGGTLTVDGAVTGSGNVIIDGGLADFNAGFKQSVTFGAGGGELELASSQTYTGTVSGFSKTGATALDLTDISYVKGTTKATFSGNATSGVLTVTDGGHTAKIKLAGDYTASTWILSSDGQGGTKVVDPVAPGMANFVQAMASFGADAGGIAANPSGPAGSLSDDSLWLANAGTTGQKTHAPT